MDYYKEKKYAMIDIRNLASEGLSLEDIQFAILEKYAFSKKFVNEYYTLLEERDLIKTKK